MFERTTSTFPDLHHVICQPVRCRLIAYPAAAILLCCLVACLAGCGAKGSAQDIIHPDRPLFRHTVGHDHKGNFPYFNLKLNYCLEKKFSSGLPGACHSVLLTPSIATNAGGNWFAAKEPITSVGSLTVHLTPAVYGLSAGNYSGTVTLTNPSAPNKILVNVELAACRALPIPKPAQLIFDYQVGGIVPSPQDVSVTFADAACRNGDPWVPLSAKTATDSGGDWLKIKSKSYAWDNDATISASPQGLRSGSYTGAITYTCREGYCMTPETVTLVVPVRLNVTASSVAPSVTEVLNSVSLLPGISTGSWLTIRGTSLSTQGERSWTSDDFDGTRLPTALNDVQVLLDGTPCVLRYSSYYEVIALVPSNRSAGPAELVVRNAVGPSSPVTVEIVNYAPELFQLETLQRFLDPSLFHGASSAFEHRAPLAASPSQDKAEGGKPGISMEASDLPSRLKKGYEASSWERAPALEEPVGESVPQATGTKERNYVLAFTPEEKLVGGKELSGARTPPARPGGELVLYGAGFGPTAPPAPPNGALVEPLPLAAPGRFVIRIGGVPARVNSVRLVSPGIYEARVTVPDLPAGEHAVVVQVQGVQSRSELYLTVGSTPAQDSVPSKSVEWEPRLPGPASRNPN